MAAPQNADPVRTARDFWTFKRAILVMLVLTPWAALTGWLGRSLLIAEENRVALAFGLFLAILPFFAILAFRPRYVFEFFRSVRVGVVNLVLIGLASIIGVLFHQEDVNFPIPKGAVDSLVTWTEEGGQRPWTRDEARAYDAYAGISGRGSGFRNAQVFFLYRFAESLKLDWVFGLDESVYGIDRERIERRLEGVREQLPAVRARFGEDFAIALDSQSQTGLITRARNKRIERIEEKFDDLWWTLFVWSDRLDLIRVYKSDWFAMYWFVLFGGVLVNTFRGGWRRLLRPNRWGFLVTHAGVLLICAGGLWSRMNEQRGILELNVGKESQVWQTWSGQPRGFHGEWTNRGSEPFAVKLDGFRADHHDVLSVNYVVTHEDGSRDFEFALDRQPEERLWDGKTLRFDRVRRPDGSLGEAQLVIEVLDKIEQSEIDPQLVPAGPDEIGTPMARIGLLVPGRDEPIEAGGLAAAYPEPFVHAPTGSRVLLGLVESEDAARTALASEVDQRWGLLQRAESDTAHQLHDVQPGLVFEEPTPNGTYTVEVVEILPDLRVQAAQNGEIVAAPLDREVEYVAPRNPAVRLRITSPSGETEMRWVLEADTGHALPAKFDEIRYRFVWDKWRAPAAHRYLLLMDEAGTLRWGEVGRPDSLRVIDEGQPLPLAGPDSVESAPRADEEFVVLQALPIAAAKSVYLPRAGADFFDNSPAAVHLAVTTPGEDGPVTETHWLRTRDGRPNLTLSYPTASGDQREVLLLFREQTEGLPIEWQSKLTILRGGEGGEPIHSGTVRVNDYLHWEGYRFFQTNHDPRDPTYSGIGVVYDPGIPFVLSGYYMVMFGTIVVFLIKPLLTRRHRGV